MFRRMLPRVEHARIIAAVEVLREASDGAKEATVQTRGVRLALHVLRGHCSKIWLAQFWDAAGNDYAIGRSQGCNAALNGIERQLRERGIHVAG